MCLPSFLPYAKEEKNNSLKTDACSDIHAKLFLQIGCLTTWSEKFKIYFMPHMGLQRKFPMILQNQGGENPTISCQYWAKKERKKAK